ncbi:MAG TPA: MATE family efflux transporter [Clostridiales bacterium UBA8960]|jgi:putative MATE family efflux protein|nr:MATE family efflux transporter [Clostridiales bacterium UBA8960]
MKKYIEKLSGKKALIMAILAMAAPAIIEMGLNTILGVADMIMIGQLIGSGAIASVGFSNQIMYFLIFTFSAFNTGAVAMISRAYGEKNLDKMKRIAEQNVVLNLIIGTCVMALAFTFRADIFKIYDIEPIIFSDALIYFNYILIGFVPMFLSFAFASILRGSGDTKTPMWITGFANFLNIIGNYVLITGWSIFPEMGIGGAALSTSLSRIVALCIYIYVLYVKNTDIKLKAEWFIDKHILGPLFRISLPGGIEQFFMQLSFLVVGIFIAKLDTNSEALFRILIQIESLSFMPAVGVSIATATLVGKSLGEKDIQKASEVGATSSLLGILWGVVVGLIFVVVPLPLLYAFTTDQSVIALGVPVMIYMAFNQPGLNYMIVMGGALRGAGDTFKLMIYTMVRLWGLFVPLSYLFIITLNQGVVGLWQAEIISIIATALIIFKRFHSRKWALISLN